MPWVNETCDRCNGSGVMSDYYKPETCSNCDGSGTAGELALRCRVCDGSGRVYVKDPGSTTCGPCGGSGVVSKYHRGDDD